ncbi:MAG: hypothetical protein SAMD01599839_08170 [Rectinema sp.]
MNQDAVKAKLLSLEIPCEDFMVIFSGKNSKKVNGIYKPGTKTIVIHNKNFQNSNALMYTALHEFAHHIAYTRQLVRGHTAHTTVFWAIFHSLISVAIEKKIYEDPYLSDGELKAKRKEILDILREQDELNKKLSISLAEMEKLSAKQSARFEDFLDRHARMPRKQAVNLIKAKLEFDLDDISSTGSPSLIDVVVSQDDDVAKAADMAARGCSIQQIKAACGKKGEEIDLFADPENIETQEDRLREMRRKLDTELRRKRRCEIRIGELSSNIQAIEHQLSFGFDEDTARKAVGG